MKRNWVKYEDSMFVNEITREVVVIMTYGDNEEYFLSQSGYYENDPYEDLELDTIINHVICNDHTYEILVDKTKDMRDINI